MDEKENQLPQPAPEPLSADFYKKLLGTPPCLTGGKCNNCGKCQH